jgi:hypothetical protein
MIQKDPIVPERIRKIPKQFSWVDHRLVRERYFDRFSHEGAALYLFLITVADSRGLSYYSDSSLICRLGMDYDTLDRARRELIGLGLVAWRKPIYQALSLEEVCPVPTIEELAHEPSLETDTRATDQLVSIRQFLKQIGKEG